jgi:TRAP-type C4-dicarboxylate transport system substrate-binding protein
MKHTRKVTALALLGAILGASAATVAAEEAVLRAVSAFAEGSRFSKNFERFVEKVNAEGKGVVQIKYIGGGGKVMNPFEVGNAVKGGVVDMANVTGAFYTNLMPEADALKLSETPIQAQRKNGAWEYINQLHNAKLNAYFLARTGDGTPFHLYLTKPIDKPDLSGLKIRVTPVYQAFFNELGATVMRTAPGEVYTALERGVVDGYGWPSQGIFDLGWHEVTKYRVDPGFYQVDVNVLVNLNSWNKLSEAQRGFLKQQAEWLEALNSENAGINTSEYARQEQQGIKTIRFSDAEAARFLEVAKEAGWNAVIQNSPDNGPKMKEALTRP